MFTCVCVEGRGRGISFNPSALLSDSPSSHIYSLSPLRVCLSFSRVPIPVLFVLCHFLVLCPYLSPFSCPTCMLISLRHIVWVTHDLIYTSLISSSHIALSLLSVFLLNLLDFGCCCSSTRATVLCIYSLVVLTASGISSRLRWVFLRASSLGLRLHLSLSLSPLTTLSPCLSSHFTQ